MYKGYEISRFGTFFKSLHMQSIRARPIYRSADIYRPITRLADISYRPFSTDKLSAINKNVLFTILLINARFFGDFACAVAHTFKHKNHALERACIRACTLKRQHVGPSDFQSICISMCGTKICPIIVFDL